MADPSMCNNPDDIESLKVQALYNYNPRPANRRVIHIYQVREEVEVPKYIDDYCLVANIQDKDGETGLHVALVARNDHWTVHPDIELQTHCDEQTLLPFCGEGDLIACPAEGGGYSDAEININISESPERTSLNPIPIDETHCATLQPNASKEARALNNRSELAPDGLQPEESPDKPVKPKP